MSLKEMVSEKGNVMLVFDNLKFFKKDCLKSGEIMWCCGSRKCNAKLYTLGEGSDRIISRKQLDHNHEPNVAQIQRQIINVAAKRKATEEISSRPSKDDNLPSCSFESTSSTIPTVGADKAKCVETIEAHVQPTISKAFRTVHSYSATQIISACLGVEDLDQSHTADYIGNQILKTLEYWNIADEKVVAVTTGPQPQYHPKVRHANVVTDQRKIRGPQSFCYFVSEGLPYSRLEEDSLHQMGTRRVVYSNPGHLKKLESRDSAESVTPTSELLAPAKDLIENAHYALSFSETTNLVDKAVGEPNILELIRSYTDDFEGVNTLLYDVIPLLTHKSNQKRVKKNRRKLKKAVKKKVKPIIVNNCQFKFETPRSKNSKTTIGFLSYPRVATRKCDHNAHNIPLHGSFLLELDSSFEIRINDIVIKTHQPENPQNYYQNIELPPLELEETTTSRIYMNFDPMKLDTINLDELRQIQASLSVMNSKIDQIPEKTPSFRRYLISLVISTQSVIAVSSAQKKMSGAIKKKNGPIWNHFPAINSDIAKCNICRQSFSYKTCFLKLNEKTRKPQKQSSVYSYSQRKLNQSAKKKIDETLLRLFYMDFQPFRIVEDDGFKAFVHELNPNYELPVFPTYREYHPDAAFSKKIQKYENFRLSSHEFPSETPLYVSIKVAGSDVAGWNVGRDKNIGTAAVFAVDNACFREKKLKKASSRQGSKLREEVFYSRTRVNQGKRVDRRDDSNWMKPAIFGKSSKDQSDFGATFNYE
ncbi:hypothetical protein TcasGA2_TC014846 [Tribolium castaneum]|uniref:FLYWCH-type domain-containing protein n=1 Tax=Tribolium castaneum TaxID=7070 RepID=D2A4D9_TRICA|nr:hypothetical protein TcasGA2_TC014846 [Tribolium castaneum]